MSKYDDSAVEELIGMVESFNFSMGQEQGALTLHCMKKIASALRPKPEMEYVLKDFVPTHSNPHEVEEMRVGDFSYDEREWNSLRGATRIPARPKPKAGKDWTYGEVETLRLLQCSAESADAGLRAVIDAINAKQGAGE